MLTSCLNFQTLGIIVEQIFSFLCIGFVVFLAIFTIEKNKDIRRPLSLWILAIFIITASLYDLLTFTNYAYFRAIFVQLSERLFHVRFLFSILLRVALIIIAIGLLMFKEWARKAIVVYGIFTIATIYWKHPYYVFENIAFMVEQAYFGEPVEQLNFPTFPWVSMFVYVTADLIFAGILIYYFTLEAIVKLYRRSDDEKTS